MSVEEIAETVGEIADRRRILRRVTGAALGLTGLAGLFPSGAMASNQGCNLCNSPGGCNTDLACAWCWQGNCYGSPGQWHYCCEGYLQTTRCDGSCPSYCSYFSGTYSC